MLLINGLYNREITEAKQFIQAEQALADTIEFKDRIFSVNRSVQQSKSETELLQLLDRKYSDKSIQNSVNNEKLPDLFSNEEQESPRPQTSDPTQTQT